MSGIGFVEHSNLVGNEMTRMIMTEEHMMQNASYRMARRVAPRRLWCGMPALVAVALTTGMVFAQPKPSNTPAETKPQPDAKKGSSKAKLDKAAGRAARAKRKGRKQIVMDKNAMWVCENTTVTLEPIWRSTKAIECSFDIRNDGTAPLQIQARGG